MSNNNGLLEHILPLCCFGESIFCGYLLCIFFFVFGSLLSGCAIINVVGVSFYGLYDGKHNTTVIFSMITVGLAYILFSVFSTIELCKKNKRKTIHEE